MRNNIERDVFVLVYHNMLKKIRETLLQDDSAKAAE
jgi:hypothetical protein